MAEIRSSIIVVKRYLWLLIVPGGITLGALGYWGNSLATKLFDFDRAERELPAAIYAYREAGLPFVASEISPEALSDAQNAAPILRRAFKQLPKGAAAKQLNASWKEPSIASADHIEPYRQALETVKRAIGKPIDFRRDWDLGPNVLFPEYADLKALAKAACLAAVLDARSGNDAQAVAHLNLARSLARWANSEPTLISILVCISIERSSLKAANLCLQSVGLNPRRCDIYLKWLDGPGESPNLKNALKGEAFVSVTTCRNLAAFGGREPFLSGEPKTFDPAVLQRDGIPANPKFRGFMTRCLQAWTEASVKTQGFGADPLTIGREIARVEEKYTNPPSTSKVMVAILFPVFEEGSKALITLQADREVHRALAEALVYKATTGSWPTRMARVDPFSKAPLKIKALPEGISIYSVGADGFDDGGLTSERARKLETERFDIVATYPR